MREINLYDINTGEDLTFDENDIKGLANLIIELLESSKGDLFEQTIDNIRDGSCFYDDNGDRICFSFKKFMKKNLL